MSAPVLEKPPEAEIAPAPEPETKEALETEEAKEAEVKGPEKPPPRFEEPVGFARGKTKLGREAQITLDRFAETIAGNKLIEKLEVSGHAAASEGKPAKRSRLAQQRAARTMQYLEGKGVDRKIMVTTSHGDACPAILTNDKKLDAPNRRSELRVLKYDGKDLGEFGQCGEDSSPITE